MSDRETGVQKQGLSCLAKLLIGGAAAPVILIVGVAIWWFARDAIAGNELAGRMAQLRADSMPYDNETLQIFYQQNTSSDDALAWIEIANRMESNEFFELVRDLPVLGMGDPIPLRVDAPWADEAVVRKFLADEAAFYRQLDSLRPKSGGVHFPVQFEGADTLLPAVQATRSMARMMRLRFDVGVRDGDSERATQSVIGTLAISRTLEGHPNLVSQLVRLAIEGVAVEMIRTGLDHDIFDADQLSRLDQTWQQRAPPTDELRIAMQGERGFVLANMLDISSGSKNPAGVRLVSGAHDRLATLDIFDEILSAITDDIFDSKVRLDVASDAMEARFDQAGLIERVDTIMTGMLVPAIGAAGTAFARSEMSVRLARTAMAVRRYHFASGQWPNSIDDLATIDFDPQANRPIGAKPFGFRVDGPADAMVWGFPIRDIDGFQAMTETPDAPPIADTFENDLYVFRLHAEAGTRKD